MSNLQRVAIAFALPVTFFIVRELVLEYSFGSAVDWLKVNAGVFGDFLAWRGSTVVMTVILLVISGVVAFYWDSIYPLLLRRAGQETPRRSSATDIGDPADQEAPHPTPAGGLQPAGNLAMRAIRGPNSIDVPLLQFQTKNEDLRELDVGGRPEALRFIEPVGKIINSEADLPWEFTSGEGKVTVKRFTAKGFVIEEKDTFGDWIRVEYYRTSQTVRPKAERGVESLAEDRQAAPVPKADPEAITAPNVDDSVVSIRADRGGSVAGVVFKNSTVAKGVQATPHERSAINRYLEHLINEGEELAAKCEAGQEVGEADFASWRQRVIAYLGDHAGQPHVARFTTGNPLFSNVENIPFSSATHEDVWSTTRAHLRRLRRIKRSFE